jgi:hypothetical protein
LKSEIGGDVIMLDAAHDAVCWPSISERVSVEDHRTGNQVRIEREGGHRFVPDVVEAFPGEIQAISVSKPALEDVFIHRTGHKFWSEEREADSREVRKTNKTKRRKRGGSLRSMILVLSLVLGLVPLAWASSGFSERHDRPLAVFGDRGRTLHDADSAHAFALLPAERVLGNARRGMLGKKKEAPPSKAPAAKASQA